MQRIQEADVTQPILIFSTTVYPNIPTNRVEIPSLVSFLRLSVQEADIAEPPSCISIWGVFKRQIQQPLCQVLSRYFAGI